MLTVLVVVGFALLTVIAFGLLVLLYRAIGGWPLVGRLDAHGIWIYPLLLLVPLTAIAASGEARAVLGDVPLLPAGATAAGVAAVAAGAIAVGLVLYRVDLATAILARRVTARRHRLATVLDGRDDALARMRPPLVALVALSVAIPVAEELVWRGWLITALRDSHGWSAGGAIALSAVSYGAIHYYFGLRNVLVKAFHGGVWGTLLVAGGGLLAPVLSHVAFELCVARGLRAGAGASAPSAPPTSQEVLHAVH